MYHEFGKVYENVSLKQYNTYKIGGNAKCVVLPENKDKLLDLLQVLKNENTKYYILGNGSNVILPDEDYEGVVILFDDICGLEIENDYLKVDAGVMLPNLNSYLLNLGYTNFYWAASIPGCVGGSVVGNAGAYKHDIFEDLISVTVIDSSLDKKILLKKDIEYGYRHTDLSDYIILDATFKLIRGDVLKTKLTIKENFEKRRNTQPLSTKNAGSVFRNPEGDSAGRIIESLGLKGKKIGGAMISDIHANFIVNYNNATAKDIIELIDLVKREVKNNYNIDLILEQKIVKWN